MSEPRDNTPRPSRRGLLAAAGGLVAAAGVSVAARAVPSEAVPRTAAEAFWGPHQAGIVTPQQSHCYFAAFDLTTDKRNDVIDLLRTPRLARDHQIVAIPTLVRKLPVPIRRIVGDLSDTAHTLVGLDLKPAAPTGVDQK